jgi:hypothetical protein
MESELSFFDAGGTNHRESPLQVKWYQVVSVAEEV